MKSHATRAPRVLLIHRYFAPDTPPYATILSRIAVALADDGFEVQVLAGQPSYNRAGADAAPAQEVMHGVSIRRWPVLHDRDSSLLKILNLIWFCIRIAGSVRAFMRSDVVMAATTPPVVVAFVACRMARLCGSRFVYHQQDIWPDVIELQGQKINRVLASMRRLDIATQRRADAVVVLSRDMADTVADRGVDRAKVTVINNFDPWVSVESDAVFHADGVLDVVFAGNLGSFQGIEDIVRAVELTAGNPLIHWHFYGDGTLRGLVESLLPQGNVSYYGHRPASEVGDFVSTRADLGIVSLKRGVIRAAYPSKTMTYLRNGCPVLALVESDSELAELVRDRQIGVAEGYEAPDQLAARLQSMTGETETVDLFSSRDRARQTYAECFGMDRQLGVWRALMSRMVAK